jgi:hypothetical protein
MICLKQNCVIVLFIAILAMITHDSITLHAQVIINEVASVHSMRIRDEDDDRTDWVELMNSDEQEIRLDGWGLSDTTNDIRKWILPANTRIAGNGYLLIQASGKDRSEPDPYDPEWLDRYSDEALAVLLMREHGETISFISAGAELHSARKVGDASQCWRGSRAGAIDFGYTGGAILLPYAINLSGNFTISHWVYTRRAGNWSALNNSQFSNRSVGILDPVRFSFNGSINMQEPLAIEQWQHLVLTRQNGSIAVYLNGLSIGKIAWSGDLSIDQIGGTSKDSSWLPFDGKIGDVLILERAMTAAEVLTLHQAQMAKALHTNWSISSDGETVVLSQPDGTVVDRLECPKLIPEISYGRLNGQSDVKRFFDLPTPCHANPTSGAYGILDPPVFSHEAGFYDSPIELTLGHTDPDVMIHYTLDGSRPSINSLDPVVWNYKNSYPVSPGLPYGAMLEANKRTQRYATTIPIGQKDPTQFLYSSINSEFSSNPRKSPESVPQATIVRATAIKRGMIPSPTSTRSFFIRGPHDLPKGLPIVSISSDGDNLFGYENGIHVAGKLADRWRAIYPTASRPWPGIAQFEQRGMAWERPASFELFSMAGNRTFSSDLGIRIHGSYSRGNYRKSLRLCARSAYGNSSLSHDFFNGLKSRDALGRSVNEFDSLILRNSGNDFNHYLFKDLMIHRLVRHLPIEAMDGFPVHHFINGEYWGINNLRERQDEHYLSNHFGIDAEEVTIISNDQFDTGIPEDIEDYNRMIEQIIGNDMTNVTQYEAARSIVDLSNLALYCAIQVYTGNHDWPHNNYDCWRRRMEQTDAHETCGRDGRWRWLFYDLDQSLNSPPQYDSLNRLLTGNYSLSKLLQSLLRNEAFRHMFINSFADLINTTMSPSRVLVEVDRTVIEYSEGRPFHSNRWNDRSTSPDISILKEFAKNRPDHMRSHLIQWFKLPGTASMTVGFKGRGVVRVNNTSYEPGTPGVNEAQRAWQGVWFRNVPIEIEAIAADGYKFSGWNELPDETSNRIRINPAEGASYTARFERVGTPMVIHSWDFQTNALVPISNGESGGLSVSNGPSAIWLREVPAQGFDSHHLRVNNPLGSVLIFRMPTTGMNSIVLEYKTRRSGQGAGRQVLSYTVDGINWITMSQYDVMDAVPQSKSFDLSSVPGVANNPVFAVRIQFEQGSGGISGNNRFDDWTLRGISALLPNVPPTISTPFNKAEVISGSTASISHELRDYITNPETEELVVYSASSAPPSAMQISVRNSQMKLSGFASPGNTAVTVVAEDDDNPPIESLLPVLIHPAPHSLKSSEYRLDGWAYEVPGDTYPSHAIFMEGDPGVEYPIQKPFSTASEPLKITDQTSGSPHSPSGFRTGGIFGMGGSGLRFSDHPDGGWAGSAIIALNTIGIEAASISWNTSINSSGAAAASLRLQARVGITSDFRDIEVDGVPIESDSSSQLGQLMHYGPVVLPIDYLNKDYVQLQWRYQPSLGDPAAQADVILLDDIRISGVTGITQYNKWVSWHLPDPAMQSDPRFSDATAISQGQPNLLRYSMNVGRHDRIEHLLPQLHNQHGARSYRFRFDPGKRDIEYRVLRSRDLIDWSEVLFDSVVHPYGTMLHAGWIELPLSQADNARSEFLRLAVRFRGEPPRRYASWRDRFFLDAVSRVNDRISGSMATHDGTPNLFRYAFGIGLYEKPSESAFGLLEKSSQGLTYRIPFDPLKKDLRYRLQHSIDLKNWNDVIFDSSNNDYRPLWDGQHLNISVMGHAAPRTGFYRMAVALNEDGIRTYDDWMRREFPAPEDRLNLSFSGPDAKSGEYTNLVRYALGAAPLNALSLSMPTLIRRNGQIYFRFPFDPLKSDLRYRVLSSTDLKDWTQSIFDSETSDVSDLIRDGWIEIPVPEALDANLFQRLQIQLR